jgi:hypothetical protein
LWTTSLNGTFRNDLGVVGTNGGISVSSTIGGTVRIRGNVRLIRGDIGKLLGKLNPTNIPFSAHADLRATVTAETRPQLLPSWRFQPDLKASAQVQEATIPIQHVGSISVRGHVQRAVDDKLAQLRNQLEAKLRADDRIEKEARRAWAKLCQSFPLDADRDGKPDLYLRVDPVVARASQPRIASNGISLQIGIEANIDVSEDGTRPDCPFPEVLQLLPIEDPRFDIALPLLVSFPKLNELVAAQLPATIKRADQGIEATIRAVRLSPHSDGHLLLAVEGKLSESRWLFGKSFEGTIYVKAIPKLDPARQVIAFESVDVDAKSRQFLGVTELLAKAAAPLIERWIAENLVIDVRKEAERLPELAKAAVAELQKTSDGIEVTTRFDPPKLLAVDFDTERLRLIAEAHGSVAVKAQ